MKFLTRLNIFAKKVAKELMPITDIEKLEHALEEIKKGLDDTKQSYYKSKGKEDYYKTEIDNAEKVKEKIVNQMKKNKENNVEKEKQEPLYNEMVTLDTRIKLNNENLTNQSKITSALLKTKNVYDRKYTDLRQNLEIMKSKEDFNNSIKEFKLDNFDIDTKEIEKNIDITFNASQYSLDDIEKEVNMIDIQLDDNGIDEFLDKL